MRRFKRRSARMNLMHFRVLTRRYFKQIFTSAGLFLPMLLQAPVMLLILFIVSQKDAFSAHDVTQANVIAFMVIVMSALMGILNSYREICKEREILSREVFGGLDITAYVFSKFFVLSVVGIVQCAILFFGSMLFIDYSFLHLSGYAFCFAAAALVNISLTAIGLFVSALLKKSESAILPVLVLIIMQVVFSDCLISLGGVADVFKYITPAAWGVAVFGHASGINGWSEWFQKSMYDYNPFIPLAALAVTAAVFVFLTVARLKRAYRQKD